MKPTTKNLIENFRRMNAGKDAAARYNVACWLRDNHAYLRAARRMGR